MSRAYNKKAAEDLGYSWEQLRDMAEAAVMEEKRLFHQYLDKVEAEENRLRGEKAQGIQTQSKSRTTVCFPTYCYELVMSD
ncbi:hypothetical protein FGRMN_10809 [Fusarium graminum]|nr:hypothetical protein FGRMN_10809 [Fusarium graminum]